MIAPGNSGFQSRDDLAARGDHVATATARQSTAMDLLGYVAL